MDVGNLMFGYRTYSVSLYLYKTVLEICRCTTWWILAAKYLLLSTISNFSPHQCFLTHLSPPLSSPSIHPSIFSSIRKEKKRGNTPAEKLLSHTVREGDGMSKIKQCSLTAQWMRSLCLSLSPTASFLPLHSLNLSISSIPPPPLSHFLHFQSAVTLVCPASIPLQPSKPYQPKQQQQTSVTTEAPANRTASNAGRAV